jgi:mannose-6-phosphate isomerase
MIVCPARLEPTFSPRPWGALSLAPFFPEMSNLAEPVGEAWMTGSESRLANGPFAGKTLAEAWPEMPPGWTGALADRNGPFPLLVKFIFAEEKLSLQVHPDDDYAARHEAAADGRGKTEMWYTLRARPGAEVLVGLKSGVTRDALERAIAGGAAEDCLEHVPLRSGDAVFVPAGTVHTIGPGLVLCEIQEHSDLTYRVYDYNRRDNNGRSRELHIAKALEVMRFGKQAGGRIAPVRIERGAVAQSYFVACRYFAAEKWEFAEPVGATTSREHLDLLIFLEGSGSIRFGKEHTAYGPAQVWMIPAALGAYQLAPAAPTWLLRTYVPRDLNELSCQLAEEGVGEAERARLVRP